MQIDRNDIKELKKFAITISWAFPTFFSLLLPWLFGYSIQHWPLVVTITLMALWLLKPSWIYYPYKVWMRVTSVLGWINTRIILGLCFYLLFMPIGRFMKLLGKLDYKDKMSRGKSSNYLFNTTQSDRKNLENPF